MPRISLFHRDRYQALERASRAVVDADLDLRHAESRRVEAIAQLRDVLASDEPIWHEGDRVETMDGRVGSVINPNEWLHQPAAIVGLTVSVDLDGETGAFLFASHELRSLSDGA